MAFRFAFITDTHLFPEATQNFGGGLQQQTSSQAIYKALIRQLNLFAPAFVVHGGDIVCGGESFGMTSGQYQASLAQAKAYEAQVQAACHYIPGNHDLDPETGAKTAYLHHFGKDGLAYTSFVVEDVRFILLDAQEVPADLTYGHIGPAQLEWLQAEMQSAAKGRQDVLLFSHQVISPPEAFQGLGARIDNFEEVLAVLDRFDNLLATFHGHLHLNRVYHRRGIPHAITSGIICYPMMWRQVFVEADHVRVASCQIDLPDIVNESASVKPENNPVLLGDESDRDFVIPRKSR